MLFNIVSSIIIILITPGLVTSPGVPPKLASVMDEYFDSACKLHSVPFALNAAERNESGCNPRLLNGLEIWRIETQGKTKGFAFVGDVRGKVRNITYAVIFDTKGTIQGMEILKYRESHGGEVANGMFRNQFRGKSSGDALTLGRDIRNITGATISCRSVTGGVKSFAALFSYLNRKGVLGDR
jgi:hypothetical protein